MSGNKLTSIIIITRNRKTEVLACLESVFKMDYPNFEVILVDNASEDGTIGAVKIKFPAVKIISSSKNLGSTGGKNLGQKKAKGEYLVFLDSDTEVEKKFLTELVRVAESDPKIGQVCPKIYYFDDKEIIWSVGASIDLFTSKAKNRGCNEKDKGQYNQITETDYSPTAYLASKKAVQSLNGHDETFFMSYGESDFGFRVKEAGFKVLFSPGSKLWHRLNQKENTGSIRSLGYNLPLRAYYFSRNRIIFMKRHSPKFQFLVFMIFLFPLFTAFIAYKIILYGGAKKFLKPHLEGSLDGLKFAFGEKPKNHWT